MKTSKSSTRRFALAAVAAVMALTATAVTVTPANADEWRRHNWGDHDGDWNGGWGGGFSIYSGPSYYYAPAPTYYYAPPPTYYYPPPPAYYAPAPYYGPSFGFSINVPLRGRY
jgi:hypothetical protein